MAGTLFMRASTLKAILCYIDPTATPKIAYDRDDLAEPLIAKVKDALGDRDGSQEVAITFGHDDVELERQFAGVCGNIGKIFQGIHQMMQ